MSCTGIPAGTIGKTFSSRSTLASSRNAPLASLHLVHSLREILVTLHETVGDAVGAGYEFEVGVGKFGERVAFVVKQLLPLAHHAQVTVVHEHYFDSHLRLEYRTQLLQGHLQASVAHEEANIPVGRADLGADGCGQAEAHRPETPRGYDAARALESEISRGEHLLLAHVGDQYRVVETLRHGIHHLAHAQMRTSGRHGGLYDLLALDVAAYAELLEPSLAVARRDLLGEHGQRAFHVARNRHVGVYYLVYLGGVDLHVDDLGVDAEFGRVARHAVVETHADGNEQVAVAVL